MKTSRDQTNRQNKQGMSKKPKPEIRDNMDSRENEEQNYKGNDITHNKKEKQSEKAKRKNQ